MKLKQEHFEERLGKLANQPFCAQPHKCSITGHGFIAPPPLSRVAPVVYLTAHAYEATRKVLAQLKTVQRGARNLNLWHLTMGILSMPKREGGLAHASLASYTLWVHSHSFVTLVCRPQAYPASQVAVSHGWAQRVGLILEESTLPYLQLAPVTIKHPSFLQGALRSYSQVRRGGGVPPSNSARHGHLALSVVSW